MVPRSGRKNVRKQDALSQFLLYKCKTGVRNRASVLFCIGCVLIAVRIIEPIFDDFQRKVSGFAGFRVLCVVLNIRTGDIQGIGIAPKGAYGFVQCGVDVGLAVRLSLRELTMSGLAHRVVTITH